LKVVGHYYFDMVTYKVMGGAVFVLGCAVLLAILPAFDLGKVHGKTLRNNRN